MSQGRRTVKVAIIGSGLAGLSAGYFLSTAKDRRAEGSDVDVEVHLFEKASALGMDSHSETFTLPKSSSSWRVDVPMRSFQGGYYPQLIALYKHLGVLFRATDFSYSFSCINNVHSKPKLRPSIIYDGASGRGGVSVPTSLQTYEHSPYGPTRVIGYLTCIFAFTLTMAVLLWNFLRLQLLSVPWFRHRDISDLSWAAWAERTAPNSWASRKLGMDKQWRIFIRDICLPLFSAVCTSSQEDVLNHPAEEFLDFIWLTFGTHHYVVSNGVRDVVARLSAPIPSSQIHLGEPTVALLPHPTDLGLASVVTSNAQQLTVHEGFSHVIFATQANHAAPIVSLYADALSDKKGEQVNTALRTRELAECLKKFEYRHTIVVNHTDGSESMLPSDPRDRRDLNLVTMTDSSSPKMDSKSYKDTNHYSEKEAITANDLDLKGLNVVPSTYTQTTHMLPRPPHILPGPLSIYQTTNPIYPPEPGSVLSVARLERALLTRDSKEAVRMLSVPPPPLSLVQSARQWAFGETRRTARLGTLQGAARRDAAEEGRTAVGIWVVGAYAYQGIPLLEGCVAGARDVVEQGVLECEGVRITRGWY